MDNLEQLKAFAEKPNREQGFDLYKNELNRVNQNIPNRDDPTIQANFRTNRLAARPRGFVQSGLLRERQELYDTLKANYQGLNSLNTDQPDISADDVEVIKYIPNSRIAYYNKLIKEGIKSKLSLCDVNYVDQVWMQDDDRRKLKRILNKLVDPNKSNNAFTAMPTNRYGAKYTCNNGNIQGEFYNPGEVALNSYEKQDGCACSLDEKVSKTHDILSIINDYQNELMQKIDLLQSTSVLDEIPMDPKLHKLISYTRDQLLETHVDYETFLRITDAFSEITQRQKSKYLLSIIDPFKHKFTKVPSELPIPSSSFSIRSNVNLVTNATGNVAFAINPFYLTTTSGNTSFSVNNDVSLTGLVASNFFLGVDIGQSLPVALYNKYRLSSAGLRLTFTSSQLSSTGFATCSVDFADTIVTGTGASNATYSTYGVFNNIENAYFKETKATRNGDSISMNYIPLDSSFVDYQTVNASKQGFVFIGYIAGAQALTTIARLDIVLNFEALVAAQYTDYLPCQVYTGGLDDLKSVNRVLVALQQENKPLSTESISEVAKTVAPDVIYDKQAKMNLGVPKIIKDKVVETVKDLQNIKNEVIDKLIPKEKKRGIFGKLMDVLSPISSGIMNAGVSMLGNSLMAPFGSKAF